MVERGDAPASRTAFHRRYATALRAHLGSAAEPGAGPARRLGKRALKLGIQTLGLARIHDSALLEMESAGKDAKRRRSSRALRASAFFLEAMEPIEETHGPAVEAKARCEQLADSLGSTKTELAAARRRLSRETGRRESLQDSLSEKVSAHRGLLRKARSMEEDLRKLSHSLLTSHEEERKRISRELHDALGQTLTAIHVGLASLRAAAADDTKKFRGSVAKTQRLVQKSMKTVHQFARDLRPTLLDDLGLVPALHSFTREFGRQNSLSVKITAPSMPAELNGGGRTALFRVAQEALVNVGRHARARNVRVSLRRTASGVCMEVWNDGRPFDVEKKQRSPTRRHLGLLCMRERMEMVGGTLQIRSSKSGGTTVRAEVPLEVAADA